MAKYKNVGMHPEELVGGVMLGPGEETDLNKEGEKDNQWLINEEILIPLETSTKSKKEAE